MASCSLKTTIIESRIKLLKKTFQAIAEIRAPTSSGFSWYDDVKCIIVERDMFDHWVRRKDSLTSHSRIKLEGVTHEKLHQDVQSDKGSLL
ncbi:retrotransposon protein [Cucumis melo var. makuwa]|uniref:Retrotransposon protein n=1 Tax=Cucumis melo var. makuwa TaxID=1194695 RepID=A0A5A7TJH4_CUCMM|nr:retrotransposon protein [Cucumis melo var. makuwa]